MDINKIIAYLFFVLMLGVISALIGWVLIFLFNALMFVASFFSDISFWEWFWMLFVGLFSFSTIRLVMTRE